MDNIKKTTLWLSVDSMPFQLDYLCCHAMADTSLVMGKVKSIEGK